MPEPETGDLPNSPRRVSFKAKFLLFLISFGITLILAELAAGVYLNWKESPDNAAWGYRSYFAIFDDPSNDIGLYMAHPYSSYDMKPNYRDITNELGFRGPPTERAKPPGVVRVICIGGSTTYGIRNEYPFSYPKLLEDELVERLGEQLGDRVEVLNAGLVSATTAETLHRLVGKILPLDPDIVIIYHAVNDLGPRAMDDPLPDYSNFRRIPLDACYGFYPYFNRVNLIRLFHSARGTRTLHEFTFHDGAFPESEQRRIENFRKNGSKLYERNLDLMLRLLASLDVQAVLPTFAFYEGGHDAWLEQVPQTLWKEGIQEHNGVIRRLVRSYRLPEVPFFEEALGHDDWFLGQVHMTDIGNREKARIFADGIEGSIRERLDSSAAKSVDQMRR